MTLKEINDAVKNIEGMTGDDEEAHSEEDTLYSDFIQYIANGGGKDLKKKAKIILKTRDIDFKRWCA